MTLRRVDRTAEMANYQVPPAQGSEVIDRRHDTCKLDLSQRNR